MMFPVTPGDEVRQSSPGGIASQVGRGSGVTGPAIGPGNGTEHRRTPFGGGRPGHPRNAHHRLRDYSAGHTPVPAA